MISPDRHGEFAAAIRRTVERFKPKNVIETGTHLGDGTTRVLHEALTKEHGDKFTLVTIEANRTYFEVAVARYAHNPEVVCLRGLSIPRDLLPTKEEIEKQTVINEQPGIYYDHPRQLRSSLYYAEQQTDGPDKQLWVACGAFGFKPDLVLLDSAGHLGWIEFQYLMDIVKGPFVLICDDGPDHIKHHRTFNFISASNRWELLKYGNERFGWFSAKWLGNTI